MAELGHQITVRLVREDHDLLQTWADEQGLRIGVACRILLRNWATQERKERGDWADG